MATTPLFRFFFLLYFPPVLFCLTLFDRLISPIAGECWRYDLHKPAVEGSPLRFSDIYIYIYIFQQKCDSDTTKMLNMLDTTTNKTIYTWPVNGSLFTIFLGGHIHWSVVPVSRTECEGGQTPSLVLTRQDLLEVAVQPHNFFIISWLWMNVPSAWYKSSAERFHCSTTHQNLIFMDLVTFIREIVFNQHFSKMV